MMGIQVNRTVLCALGAITLSCAVYDDGLISSNGGLTGGGSSALGGSRSEAGSTSVAGKGADGGSSNEAGGGGTTSEPEGGAPSEGGEGPGGMAGSGMGGSGGSTAGQSGSGGTGAGAAGTAGTAGTGGTGPVAKCSDHPITPKPTWLATASSESLGNGTEADGLYNPAFHMTDGSYAERWSSGKTQLGDEWIQIDFGAVVNLTGLTLNVNTDPGDYPRAWELRVSNKPLDFDAAVSASGEGMPGNTVMTFARVTGRYVTVRQTEMIVDGISWWTIAEVFAVCNDL